ncbi:MAG: GNVR domain-containing protein [Candidatus Eisenbacteria bacterium]|nr:GNVR domain-containing protein [Candidatus Eisenbacteria bacterium]
MPTERSSSVLLQRLTTLARWRRLILAQTLATAAVAAIVSLLLPEWFRSTASVFPPEEEQPFVASDASLALSAMNLGRASLPLLTNPSDLYGSILKSRSVREAIIEKHGLEDEFKVETMDDALKILRARTRVKVGNDGVVSVTVTDKSAAKAAAIANDYVAMLDQKVRERRRSTASAVRAFLENRVEECRSALAQAEEDLQRIQQRTGILAPEDQARAILNSAVQVELARRSREVELGMLRAQVGPSDPQYARLTREIGLLNRQLEEMDQGGGGRGPLVAQAGDPAAGAFWNDSVAAGMVAVRPQNVPLAEFPARAAVYLRAYREVKIQEALYQILIEQFEQSRIQELRDTPSVQVLDAAVPAERRSRPIRWLIVASATILAFAISYGMALGFDALERTRREDPIRWKTLGALGSSLRPSRWFGRGDDLPAP